MTIDTGIKYKTVTTRKSHRSLPEAHRFASSILTKKSHYLNISLSSPHWQLKDLLISSNYSNYLDDLHYNSNPTFYFPYKNRIFKFDYSSILENSKNSNIHTKILNYSSIKFQSNPRCLKHLDGILVTGGINNIYDPETNPIGLHKGSFSLFNSNTSITENFQIGEFITNSVSINKYSNLNYKSFICNNDKFLYEFDITNSRIVQSSNPIYLKVALNHSILSNDNKTQIIVGDSSKIFINHPLEKNNNNNNYNNNMEIIQTDGDCGFSTSFLSNNNQFITCFQDGLALIYDLRNLSIPIHKIYSTRPKTQPGAFRVVKTSNYNNDLICISEHQGRIHLIDSRNFDNHSVLLLPKYLYNVPPSIDVSYNDMNNDNNNCFEMFGKYPIAVSTNNNKSNSQYYNQPIIKDIDEFKDLNHFGGELNLGYLESYRYMDNKFRNFNNNSFNYYNEDNNNIDNSNAYKIILQGTLDREDILKRKITNNYKPQLSNLLTYTDSCPIQFRDKIRNEEDGEEIENEQNGNEEEMEEDEDGDDEDEQNMESDDDINDENTEIRYLNDQWWNVNNDSNNNNFKKIWPWGKEIINDDNHNNNTTKLNNYKIMETPFRDPFFYIDSDIEINGLELANRNGNTTLCIGTKEGIIFWDVNNWERKSFPSFGYV